MVLGELMDYGMISNATVQITRLTAPTPSCGKSLGHQDMAHHPCGRVPSVPGLVDVPVEVDLHVHGRHPREAPNVALKPRAQVVRHLHSLQVDRVVHVGPVCLALKPAVPDLHVVRSLRVMDGQRPRCYSAGYGPLIRAELSFPWPQATASGFILNVDGDAGAELLVE